MADISSSSRILILVFALAMIAVSFLIGIIGRKKVTSSQAYYGGTGMFGSFAIGLSSMAGIVSAFAIVGCNGLVYANGNSMGLWMMTSCAGPFAFILLAKRVRAMAEVGTVASLGDITDMRFNHSRLIKGVMSIILLLGCVAYLASQIKAGSELLTHLMGWDPLVAGLIIFGILTIYMSISGEVGGIMTQTFQGLVMVIAGIIIIISFFKITGGFGVIVDAVSNADTVTANGVTKEFSPGLMNAWGTSAPATVFAWVFIPIVGTIGQPQVISRIYALKDPNDIPKTAFYNCLSHMVIATVSIVVGFSVLYLVATGKIQPFKQADRAVFLFADYCGIVTQLFVYAAVLAAAMSSASMYLSVAATALSRDIPAALGKSFGEKKQMRISRIVMFIIGFVSIYFSVTNADGVAILGTFGWGTLMSATFPTFILGLLWKKASRKGVSLGLVVALVLNLLSLTGLKWPGALPWYVNVIAITLAVTVIGSLCMPDAKLDKKLETVIDL